MQGISKLIHEDDAKKVYVVTDDNGWLYGVYQSVKQACAYIVDWIDAAREDDKDGDYSNFDNKLVFEAPERWSFNGYLIRQTTIRE